MVFSHGVAELNPRLEQQHVRAAGMPLDSVSLLLALVHVDDLELASQERMYGALGGSLIHVVALMLAALIQARARERCRRAEIVALAHTLNISVTAEGIETHEQAAHLQRLGCSGGQGYLIARPMPASGVQLQPAVLMRAA